MIYGFRSNYGSNTSKEEIYRVLEGHAHWINRDCENWQHMQANLSRLNLSDFDFSGMDLRYVIFEKANLENANFESANLYGANMENAFLKNVNFHNATLSQANLRTAVLIKTILTKANLYGTDLSYSHGDNLDFTFANVPYVNFTQSHLKAVNFTEANLFNTNFSEAILEDINFDDAYIYDTIFNKADFISVENPPYVPLACPEVGSFIAYKKCKRLIVELEIPADAKRSSATGRKCRCNKAKVLRILYPDRTVSNFTEISSDRDKSFIYTVGQMVSVDDFDENRWHECTTGIHFFISFQEAVNYEF